MRSWKPSQCRKSGRRGLALAVGLAALAGPGCAGSAAPERIVLIVVDTLRRDFLSCYGASRLTPHMDALAGRGRAVRADPVDL